MFDEVGKQTGEQILRGAERVWREKESSRTPRANNLACSPLESGLFNSSYLKDRNHPYLPSRNFIDMGWEIADASWFDVGK